MLVSIIIPVYNAERYIERCIDSVIKQSHTNWELLLIDDGSRDSSGSICDKYSLTDNRIHVYHKQNGGVSSARNLGIEKANGEWIAFVDADDYIKEDYLSDMVSSECDLVACGFECTCGEVVSFKSRIVHILRYGTAIGLIMPNHPFYAPWGKLFKTSIIKDNKLMFDEKLHLAEDTIFCWEYLSKINTIQYVSNTNYIYEGDPKDHSKYTTAYEENCQLAIRMGMCYDAMAKRTGGKSIDHLKRWIPGRLLKTPRLLEDHTDAECYDLFKENIKEASSKEYVESIGKYILMYIAGLYMENHSEYSRERISRFFTLPIEAYSATFSSRAFYKLVFFKNIIDRYFWLCISFSLIQWFRLLKRMSLIKIFIIQKIYE